MSYEAVRADDVPFDPNALITATDVQAAIDETLALANQRQISPLRRKFNFSAAGQPTTFHSELGHPNDQGWTENIPGGAPCNSFMTTAIYDGSLKQVLQIVDEGTGCRIEYQSPLSLAQWQQIDANGCEYAIIARLLGNNGGFMSLQADIAENPVDSQNRRLILTFLRDGDFLRVGSVDTGIYTNMDGTGGKPTVLWDDWFVFQVPIIGDLTSHLTAGNGYPVYVNGSLIVGLDAPFAVNLGGLYSGSRFGSGSTSQTDRTYQVLEFGVTLPT